MQSWNKPLLLGILFVSCFSIVSAQTKTKGKRKGEFYFSWGYNTEWYTRSNVHVSQPELLNNYTFENIRGHDHKGWDEGLFSKALTIPQYNYRLGYIFNREKGFGFEINFDHTKFIFAEDQEARLKGTLNGKFAGKFTPRKRMRILNLISSERLELVLLFLTLKTAFSEMQMSPTSSLAVGMLAQKDLCGLPFSNMPISNIVIR